MQVEMASVQSGERKVGHWNESLEFQPAPAVSPVKGSKLDGVGRATAGPRGDQANQGRCKHFEARAFSRFSMKTGRFPSGVCEARESYRAVVASSTSQRDQK